MDTTKINPKGKTLWGLLLVLGYLFLPCLFSYLCFSRWLPFHLTGKQFLACYTIFMLTGYFLLRTTAGRHTAPDKRLVAVFLCLSITIALARIIQGLYHHKPVFYLVLLATGNCLLLASCSGLKRKEAGSGSGRQ